MKKLNEADLNGKFNKIETIDAIKLVDLNIKRQEIAHLMRIENFRKSIHNSK